MKKRVLVVTMLFCLSMAACGIGTNHAGEETGMTEAYAAQSLESVDAAAEEKAPNDGRMEGKTENEQSDPEMVQAETGETQQEEKSENTVTYDADGVYMQVTLPQEWSYEVLTPEMIKTDGMESCMIRYWLTENPDISFELAYCPFFGICGTGVTIEHTELDSGLSATWYTENIEGKVWFSICMEKPEDSPTEGSYVINGELEEELWNQYKDAAMDIVRTIVVK